MKKAKIKRKPKGYWQDINNLINHLLPVCKDCNKYFSYKGSTYGGPVFCKSIFNTKNLNIIINEIFKYYDNKILAYNILFILI